MLLLLLWQVQVGLSVWSSNGSHVSGRRTSLISPAGVYVHVICHSLSAAICTEKQQQTIIYYYYAVLLLEAALHVTPRFSVCLSVCPVPTVKSTTQKHTRTMFKLIGKVTQVRSNWPVYSDTTQLHSTSSWVELRCVAINGPLHKLQWNVSLYVTVNNTHTGLLLCGSHKLD